LKEEALDRIMWRNRFGRGFGPVVWQITDDDDDDDDNDDEQLCTCINLSDTVAVMNITNLGSFCKTR